ncbi:WD40 repeat domain-containing protein [Actinophytocola oryzae]|uniref:WD40 repeat protein n=1 Tax=Actinophytocola oryzae TaxID=502181 RepID=A0A4R7UQY1_9PSEU|nr:WD40 repeat domain-containing protein [Actinophytocola oryzae]TDV36829.1 WD40 repeat protein [Actinophytocola oryzae]
MTTSAQPGPDGAVRAHRRVAEVLAGLAARSVDVPPHPYVRRYLTEHAARGGVLDDEHVPGHFLPWETSGSVRGQLGMPISEDPSRLRLAAWACIEAFLGDVGVESRHVSLAVMCRAFGAPMPAGARRVEPMWVRMSVAGNVLLSGEHPVWAMTPVPLPDGRLLLATASRASTVTMVDPATGNRVGDPFAGHRGSVRALAALPGDVSLLATGGDDGTVRLWDPTTGTQTGQMRDGHDGPVLALAVVPAPGGTTLLASSGADRTVRLWDPDSLREVIPPIASGWVRALAAVPVSDGVSWLAAAGTDELVRLWDLTGAAREPLVGHTEVTRALAVLPGPSGRPVLASGGYDGAILRWDPEAGRQVGEPLLGSGGPVFSLVTSRFPDGRTILVSAHADGLVRLWDPVTGGQAGEPVLAHVRPVRTMTSLPVADGRVLVATASWAARVWDPAVPQRSSADASGRCDLMAVVPLDGDLVVAMVRGADVDLWDVGDGSRELRASFRHGSRVRAIATLTIPGLGTVLATGDDDGEVRLWSAASGEPVLARVGPHPNGVLALTGVPAGDRTLLAVACGRTVYLWDPETGEAAGSLGEHPHAVCAVAAVPVPDGRTLLAAASGRVVYLWDPVAGTRVGELAGHDDHVNALTVTQSADGTALLVSVADDRTLRRWDPSTGTQAGEPSTGHKGQVCAVTSATAPGGPLVASASYDGNVRFWDPRTGQGDLVVVLGGPLSHVAMAAGADRAVLAVCGPAGVVVLAVRR